MSKKAKRIHLMSTKGPWAACGRYLRNFPNLKQTFDPAEATCAHCKDQISYRLAVELEEKELLEREKEETNEK